MATDGSSGPGAGRRAYPSGLLRSLPQPLHLFAYLTQGCHYHCGEFVDGNESLLEAQDRLTLTCAALLPQGATVLDVGCGLGGASMMLSGLGHPTLGVDPCPEAVAFARQADGDGAEFQVNGFFEATDPSGPAGSGPDVLLFLEVLQYFRQLDRVLARCASATGEGALIVFADVFALRELSWDIAPFHRMDALTEAAAPAGLGLLVRHTMTDRVAPTPRHLLRQLTERRDELVDFFAPARPRIGREIAELGQQCEHLVTAFKQGDLAYEIAVFRRERGPSRTRN